MGKQWWKSKTLWFNFVCAALTALEASTGLFQPLVGSYFYIGMSVMLPAVNSMLRYITTAGIVK